MIALYFYRYLSHLTFIGKEKKILLFKCKESEWVEVEVVHGREWNSVAQKD